jgi:hypothetical protein
LSCARSSAEAPARAQQAEPLLLRSASLLRSLQALAARWLERA